MSTLAAVVICLVVGVSDGDTITVRCGDLPQERIRLLEIDAPEKKQAFGQHAKQELSNLVYGQTIDVEPRGKDRYKRTLAHLKLDGLDINREMVRRGYAWCYRQYLKDLSCLEDERAARDAKKGLWRDANAQPPWEFRHPRR